MNVSGLKCLLDNIKDENPALAEKNFKRIEVVSILGKAFLRITFCDGTEELYKLYERDECND